MNKDNKQLIIGAISAAIIAVALTCVAKDAAKQSRRFNAARLVAVDLLSYNEAKEIKDFDIISLHEFCIRRAKDAVKANNLE